jgi:hypothetical protein
MIPCLLAGKPAMQKWLIEEPCPLPVIIRFSSCHHPRKRMIQ